MKPEYVLGDSQTVQQMKAGTALSPFCGQTVDFLNMVSKILLKDVQAKQYADVITFAFWCRKASIMEMKKKILWLAYAEEKGVMGRGIVFHIAPSNVAMNFAYSFAAALIAGNANIVRLPSKQFPQIDCFCSALKEALDQYPEFRRFICFVRYGHETEITDYFSSLCDVRVIWGGDRTIQEIRRSPLKIRGKEIVFADRYSIGVIDAESYLGLAEEQKKKTAQDFYNDTYLMDQNACTSPMLIVWIGDEENAEYAQKSFWKKNFELLKGKYELQAVQAVKKLEAAYKLAAAVPYTKMVKESGIDNTIVRIKVPKLSPELMEYRSNSGFFMEYVTQNLEDLLTVFQERCQTLSYLGEHLENDIKELIKEYHPSGVDRIVPMGKTLEFALIWDGYDLIREMSREIG